jgi:hypothetical protein
LYGVGRIHTRIEINHAIPSGSESHASAYDNPVIYAGRYVALVNITYASRGLIGEKNHGKSGARRYGLAKLALIIS